MDKGKRKEKAVGACSIEQASASSGPEPGRIPGHEPGTGKGPDTSHSHSPQESDTASSPRQRAPPPPPHDPETAAPFPISFAQIVELITTGQPIPGIRDVPDKVSEEEASESAKGNMVKPWESV